jgi:hypothetical protein
MFDLELNFINILIIFFSAICIFLVFSIILWIRNIYLTKRWKLSLTKIDAFFLWVVYMLVFLAIIFCFMVMLWYYIYLPTFLTEPVIFILKPLTNIMLKFDLLAFFYCKWFCQWEWSIIQVFTIIPSWLIIWWLLWILISRFRKNWA